MAEKQSWSQIIAKWLRVEKEDEEWREMVAYSHREVGELVRELHRARRDEERVRDQLMEARTVSDEEIQDAYNRGMRADIPPTRLRH